MNRGNAFAVSSYHQVQVTTADKREIVLYLYDGTIRFLNRATAAIEAQNVAEKCKCLSKAMDIVMELTCMLDFDKGGDIAQVTELRLARVLAASGQAEQALDVLQQAGSVSYSASYALARGDVLLQLGRTDEARDAYTDAKALAGQSGGQVNGINGGLRRFGRQWQLGAKIAF